MWGRDGYLIKISIGYASWLSSQLYRKLLSVFKYLYIKSKKYIFINTIFSPIFLFKKYINFFSFIIDKKYLDSVKNFNQYCLVKKE